MCHGTKQINGVALVRELGRQSTCDGNQKQFAKSSARKMDGQADGIVIQRPFVRCATIPPVHPRLTALLSPLCFLCKFLPIRKLDQRGDGARIHQRRLEMLSSTDSICVRVRYLLRHEVEQRSVTAWRQNVEWRFRTAEHVVPDRLSPSLARDRESLPPSDPSTSSPRTNRRARPSYKPRSAQNRVAPWH